MKKLWWSAATVSVAVPHTQAAVLVFDLGDQVVAAEGGRLFIDLDTGTSSTGDFGGADLEVAAFENYTFLQGSDGWLVAASSGQVAIRYNAGAALAFSNREGFAYVESYGVGPWDGETGTTTSYLALSNTGTAKEAWVAMRFDDASNQITLESFGVAPASDNMTAGQAPVPEPAETAVIMALLAGGAALYRRRKPRAA